MTTIITDNKPRNLLTWEELTTKEQQKFDDDYADGPNWDDDYEFVRYKGEVYCLSDFVIVPSVTNWDGVITDTFFSGILVKFTPDAEAVIMGRYYE